MLAGTALQQSYAPSREPGTADATIAVRGLTHRYPGSAAAALDRIDFEVPRGSLTGLIGPNGAGKSTLIALLTGILPVQQGRVTVQGAPPRRRELQTASSLVPQACAFYAALSGRENLRFFAGVHGLTGQQYRRNAADAIEVARLDDVLDQPAGTYSGGLQRRLNLALGLINRPEILYLDEPTVGVDAVSRRYIVEAIGRLRNQGTTIVYTSHYMEEVEDLCDQVTVIDRGRVVAAGATEALLAQWGGTSVRVRLSASLPPEAAERLGPWLADGEGGATLHLRASHPEELSSIIQALATSGTGIEELHFGVERLADVYWRLVGDEGRR